MSRSKVATDQLHRLKSKTVKSRTEQKVEQNRTKSRTENSKQESDDIDDITDVIF